MVVRKSLSCHSSSTLSGASLLADRICLVRTTCGREAWAPGGRVQSKHVAPSLPAASNLLS